MTTPATLVAPAVNVKVVVLIVAGFMALVKVALMTTGLPHVKVEPVRGFTEVTAGGVRGLPGFPAFVSESPQPASTPANRNARIHTLVNFSLRISFSPSFRDKSFLSAGCCRKGFAKVERGTGFSIRTNPGATLYIATHEFIVCAILNTTHEPTPNKERCSIAQ